MTIKEAYEKFETLCMDFIERAHNIYLSKERLDYDSLLPEVYGDVPIAEAMKHELHDILKAKNRLYDTIMDEAYEKLTGELAMDWQYNVSAKAVAAFTAIDLTTYVDLEKEDKKFSRPSIYYAVMDCSYWLVMADAYARHIIDSL